LILKIGWSALAAETLETSGRNEKIGIGEQKVNQRDSGLAGRLEIPMVDRCRVEARDLPERQRFNDARHPAERLVLGLPFAFWLFLAVFRPARCLARAISRASALASAFLPDRHVFRPGPAGLQGRFLLTLVVLH
jgi:hypothetical protein